MYTITLQPSGQTFTADEQENILDAGLRQGIMLPYGCRGGACGSCAVTVKQGELSYPDGEPMGLAPFDMERGKAFLCQAVANSDLELDCPQVSSTQDIEVKVLPVRVEKLRKMNDDVMEMTLKLPASERLRFNAGQYVDLLLRGGKRRAFSLANAPFDDQYLELHIRHVPGGHFTSTVFEGMKEKALLRLEGPLGSFYIRDSERPIILIGGGTGFAPLKSMIEQMKAKGFDRPVHLYWGVRAKADLYMDVLVKDWNFRFPELTYVPVLSEPKEDDQWEGRTGWVHDAVLADFDDLAAFDIYLSGPPPMIEAAKTSLLAKGVPDDQMYSDSFEYAADTLQAIANSEEDDS
uniref:2-polyprenylphenol hydroxylase and related flavodoxin oxidoreductases / CDP-6-deoxy-delta-3,4-glucoseen reductase-like n=1 Tax=uncultured Thiotrichaceae bacterium TaxID=298394 RepID=A0A6S6TKX8_9GAMM|nr:MAG: 2-polyprenylphenol hydroxylase and related flavodoxin oxidoreductases / CDP-6-deoxy-delta-3,4-glucoseen reductase-like [uncultured Thiotrichaceae bacterium]